MTCGASYLVLPEDDTKVERLWFFDDKGRNRHLAYGHRKCFAQPPSAFRFRKELSPIELMLALNFRS
jgi:hypothetical protein